ncbi:MAG: sodium/proline symporter, partial [Saprospiraceae bacterium]
FVVQDMESVGAYFVKLDVLAPSFLVAMIFGFIFSKFFPPQHPAVDI